MKKILQYRLTLRDMMMLSIASITAVTILSFLGRFHWFFDNLGCFHVQYTVLILICGLGCCMGRFWKCLAVSLLVAAINLYHVLPLYIPVQTKGSGDRELRLMLTNVFTSNSKYTLLEDYIFEVDPDILLMEEINSDWFANMTRIRDEYAYSKGVPRDDNFGIMLFSKYPLENLEVKSFVRGGVPSIVCDLDIDGDTVHFIGTHPLPPIGLDYATQRNEQMSAVAEYCAAVNDRPVILLGDLNMPHWSYHFKQLETRSGLRNSCYGFGVQFSWPAFGVLQFISNPIDHCLVSDEIAVVDRTIGKFVGSDHYPLIVDLKL